MDKKIDMLCELMDCIVEDAKHNKDSYSIEQMGEITDMIKDLSEAKEKCYKACCYKEAYEGMKEEKKHPERMGYDNWRYSSGRFAPTGSGHRSGYQHPFMMDDIHEDWDVMAGYTPSGSGNRSQSGSRMGYTDGDHKGSSYEGYKRARRYYHESKSPEDKKEMERHADEHLHETIESMKDIWQDADPQLKSRMKNELTKAINEMK